MRTKHKSYKDIRTENLKLFVSKTEVKEKFKNAYNSNSCISIFLCFLTTIIIIIINYNILPYHSNITNFFFQYLNSTTTSKTNNNINNNNNKKIIQDMGGQVTLLNNINFIWQRYDTKKNKNSKGVIFLAHGCKHEATEWFRNSSVCSHCYGMPVESKIVKTLVLTGYTVIAMSSIINQNKSQCWHVNDREYISKSIKYVYKKLNTTIEKTSLFAIGIANGGVFLGNYAKSLSDSFDITFSAIALMNCGIWHKNFDQDFYPSILFIDMSRNYELSLHNFETMKLLKEKNIATAQFSCEPRKLTKFYFYEISSGIDFTKKESETLYNKLFSENLIWPGSGILMKDPSIDKNLRLYKDVFYFFINIF
jgi:hypothetical protein